MAYRDPVFYFYHAARHGAALGGSFAVSSARTVGGDPQLIDSLVDAPLTLTDTLLTEVGSYTVPIDGTAISQAVDTLIVAGHNWEGADVSVLAQPSSLDLIASDPTVSVADGVAFPVALDQNVPFTSKTQLEVQITTNGGAEDSTVPSVGELFFTQARTMTRGPMPNWDHPWRRWQERLATQGGVSHAWQTGVARKTFEMTWENVSGADLTLLTDMREQTAGYAHSFWFLPPDTDYGLIQVEVAGEPLWDHAWQGSVPAHRVTLSLVEVLG